MHLPAEVRHPVGRGGKLFEIPNIGAKPMGAAARMFDFEFGEIEFGLTAAEESDAHPGLSEANGEALADSAPGPGDQRGHVLVRFQKGILPPAQADCRSPPVVTRTMYRRTWRF